jgi:hypothetical protein
LFCSSAQFQRSHRTALLVALMQLLESMPGK